MYTASAVASSNLTGIPFSIIFFLFIVNTIILQVHKKVNQIKYQLISVGRITLC